MPLNLVKIFIPAGEVAKPGSEIGRGLVAVVTLERGRVHSHLGAHRRSVRKQGSAQDPQSRDRRRPRRAWDSRVRVLADKII